MKSTKIEKKPFTMEDFEKGLMLAGFLSPNSVVEINEREALAQHEAIQIKDKPKNVYFKRVVLAAEIVSKLHDEPTLGRIKFQKLVYLCEHTVGMELQKRYAKQAAGPFDNKFMHSINKEFEKNKWFSVIKERKDGFERTKYIPSENQDGHRSYYQNYFKNEDEKIQYIIELFRKLTTDKTELAATLFSCVLELQSKHSLVNKSELLKLFYDWSEKKKRFHENEVLGSLSWLCEKGLVPSEILME